VDLAALGSAVPYVTGLREGRFIELKLTEKLMVLGLKLALRIAKKMVITKLDLYDLTVNCGTLGLSPYAKHLEFVHEERRLTTADNNAIFNLDGSRTPEP
jgi:hypothetical protein